MNGRDEPNCAGYVARKGPMSRLALILAVTLTAFVGCDMNDSIPPPAPPSDRGPQPQPRPGPVDAGDTDPPFPIGDGGPSAIDAADLSCGDFGGPCCTDGPACADFNRCDPDLGLCAACGEIADDCCPEGPACQPGLSCTAGVCGP